MKIVTLEIGSSAVKAGLAEFDAASGADTPVTLIAVEEEPIESSVRYGRIHNVEDVKNRALAALERLGSHPQMKDCTLQGVYTSVAGRSLGTISATHTLTMADETLIDEQIVERLENGALAEIPQNREVMCVIPLEYVVDGVKTARPVGSYGRTISGRFNVVVCDPLNTRNIERVLVDRLNLDICGYVVLPLAIADAALTVEDRSAGVMLVDLGAETTTVTILHRGNITYIATIPMGSRNITRDISMGMAVTEERADDMKIRLGNAMPENGAGITEEQVELDSYVQARAAEIVDNIVAHIEFAGLTADQLRGGIIMTGRGSKLRNLCTLLSRQAGLPVRMAMPAARIKIADTSINATDAMDIIAVTLDSARHARRADAAACLVEKAPEQPREEERVEENVKESEPHAHPGGYSREDEADIYEHGSFNRGTGDQLEDEPEPAEDYSGSDEDILSDYNEEGRSSSRKPERHTPASRGPKRPSKLSTWATSIGKRLSGIIQNETEGADLDD